MSHANRLSAAHNRIRSRFGTDTAEDQLYCWHSGAQVTCYQPGGTRGRNILSQILARDESLTLHATKSEFTTVPKPGDDLLLGTTQATARTLRIDTVKTTHIRPFYEIELIDPNTATTAAAA